MKTKFVIPAALLLAGCSSAPVKQTQTKVVRRPAQHRRFIPKYDLAGSWNSDNSVERSDTHRRGRHVVSTYNTADYEHVFEGDYVDEQTIDGIQTRRKLADDTTTRMHLTIKLLSPDEGRVDWVALDSNSDLGKGQTGVAIIKRVLLPQH